MIMHCGIGNGGDEPYALHCKKYKPKKQIAEEPDEFPGCPPGCMC
jgi:hypothetical protein